MTSVRAEQYRFLSGQEGQLLSWSLLLPSSLLFNAMTSSTQSQKGQWQCWRAAMRRLLYEKQDDRVLWCRAKKGGSILTRADCMPRTSYEGEQHGWKLCGHPMWSHVHCGLIYVLCLRYLHCRHVLEQRREVHNCRNLEPIVNILHLSWCRSISGPSYLFLFHAGMKSPRRYFLQSTVITKDIFQLLLQHRLTCVMFPHLQICRYFPEDIFFKINVYLTLVTSLDMSIYYKSSKMYPSHWWVIKCQVYLGWPFEMWATNK